MVSPIDDSQSLVEQYHCPLVSFVIHSTQPTYLAIIFEEEVTEVLNLGNLKNFIRLFFAFDGNYILCHVRLSDENVTLSMFSSI